MRNKVKFAFKRGQLFYEKLNGRVWVVKDKHDKDFQETAFYVIRAIRGANTKKLRTNIAPIEKTVSEETLIRSMMAIRNEDAIETVQVLYGT